MQKISLSLSNTQFRVVEMLLIEKALKDESTISKTIAREMIIKLQELMIDRPPHLEELDSEFEYDLRK